jgi:hypothetical protein
MPKAVERKARPFAWLFLCAALGGLLYLVWSYPVVVGAFFLGAATVSAVMNRIRARQVRRLAASRAGEGICEFARSFNPRMTDTWIIRAVYEEVQACVHSELPLRASDLLQQDLHIDPDDLDMDVVRRAVERTGRSPRESKRNPYYDRVRSVSDLVNFFNNQPRIDSILRVG